ncbi:SpoIIE family protein phosphatase [Ectobacillus ponti]|uniref:SpoIIE family protein phosphatase n=1 Tax=Ectobacillus ponti TaxID=2961894 RepID=A0AA42BQJ3_9BACI|nr:SpoIIE family protein phosphatase [Ectobacillus ponti]MCP8969461.1 SpoIIE family protein phosphatase [Ectobacillus ponti]
MRRNAAQIIAAMEERKQQEKFVAKLVEDFSFSSLEQIADTVSRAFQVPLCLISFRQGQKQCIQASAGVPKEIREVALDFAPCKFVYAAEAAQVMLQPQQQMGEEYKSVISALGVQFYAGVPLRLQNAVIGTLCIMDTKPRTFTRQEQEMLSSFGGWVESELDLRANMELQRVTKDELYELTAKYEHVIQHVQEVIFQIDQEGNWTFLNPSWTALTGFLPEESLEKSFVAFVHPDYHEEVTLDFRSVLQGEIDMYHKEIKGLHKNGDTIWVKVSSQRFRNAKGEMIGIAGTLTDISERRRIEQIKQEELDLARRVQQVVLSDPIRNEKVQVEALYMASEQLSGDMYFWCRIDEHRYGIMVLDVMGHGVPAALISMSIRSLLRGMVKRLAEPIQVMEELNRQLNVLYPSEDAHFMSYATGIYVLVDTKQQRIEYVNAGHPAGYLLRETGELVPMTKGCMPLGIMPDLPAEKGTISYSGEAKLLLYTDGLLELISPEAGAKLNKEDVLDWVSRSPEEQEELVAQKRIKQHAYDDICIITAVLSGTGLRKAEWRKEDGVD